MDQQPYPPAPPHGYPPVDHQQHYPPAPTHPPVDQQHYPPAAPSGYPPVDHQQHLHDNPYIITNQQSAPYPPQGPPPGSASYVTAGQPTGYPPFGGGSSYQVAGQPSHPQTSCPPPAAAKAPPLSTKSVAVVNPHFCAPYPVDLILVRKVLKLTEDNFDVTDVNGNLIFRIKDHFTLLRERRVIHDAAGHPIVTIREKMMSAHRRFQVFKGDSKDHKDLLFSAKQSSLIQMKTKLDVFLATNTKEDVCDFKVKGSWLERSCVIYAGNSSTIIAQMHKKHTVQSVVLGKDTFTVTVYPNVDHAFIIALIVVLDGVNDARAAT